MAGDLLGGYLGGLPRVQADELARVNGPGLAALRGYLNSGQAVAFLGAGASALSKNRNSDARQAQPRSRSKSCRHVM